MKRFYAYLVAAFALTATACSTDPTEEIPAEPIQTGTVEMTFSASNETRTTLDYVNRATVWCGDDTISILDDQGGNNLFTIKETDGEYAKFEGKVNEGATKFVAVYPYNDAYEWDGTTISGITIPTAQVCKAGTFPEGANITVAVADENYSLAFKNVCAVMKFQVKAASQSVTFATNGTEAVAGTVSVDFDESGIPVATATAAATSIELTCEGGFEPGEDYFFTAVPNTYANGIKALVDNREVKKLDTSITIKRSIVTSLKVLPYQYRIYFLSKDLGWTNTYVHVFDSKKDLTNYPGVKITSNTEQIGSYKYYYYNIPLDGADGEKYNFIPTTGATANSGSGNVNWKIEVDNLKNLTFTEDKYFRLTARGAVEINPNDESTFGYTIYVFDQKSVNKPSNYYVWGDNNAFKNHYGTWNYTWPGQSRTEACYYIPANDNGWRHYYYVIVPPALHKKSFSFIANRTNGGQTSDVVVSNLSSDYYVGDWNGGYWVETDKTKPITKTN